MPDQANPTARSRERAEARRRRIIEGGASRLASITGRPLNAEEMSATRVNETNVAPSRRRATSLDETIPDRLTEEAARDLYRMSRNQPPQQSAAEHIVATRMHIALYALMVYHLLKTNGITDSFLYFPLLMWEWVEFFYFFSIQPEKIPLVETITTLFGLHPFLVHLGYALVIRVSFIARDVCLYTFTMIMVNALSIAFN